MTLTGTVQNNYTAQIVVSGNLTGFVQDSVLGRVPGNFNPPVVNPFGTLGAQIYTLAGVPSNLLGANGDLYVNTTNGDYYRKASGVWGSPVGNLTGPQGPAGGPGLTEITETFQLDSSDVSAKYRLLAHVPAVPANLKCAVSGLGGLFYGIDFSYALQSGPTPSVTWDSLDLEDVLVVDDNLQVTYWY